MYRDNSLIPKEAIRMAALGALVGGPRGYAEVASEVRQFGARIVGPSLDLLGPSIELLKFEGLIEPVGGNGAADPQVRLTAAGMAALKDYLRARVRPGITDFNKLVIALKLRFIEVLPADERRVQIEELAEMYQGELARLHDLRSHGEWAGGLLPDWLGLEVELVEKRIAWCGALLSRL
jgi:hypothetical protein